MLGTLSLVIMKVPSSFYIMLFCEIKFSFLKTSSTSFTKEESFIRKVGFCRLNIIIKQGS